MSRNSFFPNLTVPRLRCSIKLSMDADLSKFLSGLKSFADGRVEDALHYASRFVDKEPLDIMREINLGSPGGVAAALKKSKERIPVSELVEWNLEAYSKSEDRYTQGEKEDRLRILERILEYNRSGPSPKDLDALGVALEHRADDHFDRILREMKELGVDKSDLLLGCKALAKFGDSGMFGVVVKSGFYDKEWNDEIMSEVCSRASGSSEMAAHLIDLGVEPTAGGKHGPLLKFDREVKISNISEKRGRVLHVLSRYSDKDIQSIPPMVLKNLNRSALKEIERRKSLIVNKVLNKHTTPLELS